MDSDKVNRVPSLVEKLIKQILPSKYMPRYQAYCLRLLSSRLSPSVVQEETSVRDYILKRLNSSQATKFQNLYLRLLKNKQLKNKHAVLYLLSKLEADKTISIPGTPLESIAPKKKEPKAPEISYSVSKPKQAHPVVHNELIRDILFSFQGIEGRYIKFSVLEDAFLVERDADVKEPVKKMVEELCEMGWLYRKVTNFINQNIEEESLARQSLCYAFQSELTEYYRLIALLEQQREELGSLNLRKLYMWCVEPLERMKWLGILADSSENLKGGRLISSLYMYSQIGNPAVNSLLTRILDEVSVCILSMTQKWMLEGELEDPYNEFFVEPDFMVPDDQLWTRKYSLKDEMVPAFFDENLANKILSTGKSINFLRKCCEEEEWSAQAPLEMPKIHNLFSLKEWVFNTAQVTNVQLIKVLLEKYKFKGHCDSLRKYLLLGQGDFHHYLMELLSETLNENAKNIYKHNLVSVLESAIRASNLQFDDEEFLLRLDVKLLEASPGDTGWDVFTLDYKVESPLITIFTGEVMENYLRLFKFLWSIKRVHFFMNNYQRTRELLVLDRMPDIRKYLRKAQLLRHEISHFINILTNYLMVEVVDGSWDTFCSDLQEVSDLDMLIQIHKKFLDTVTERAFLKFTEETEAVHKQLKRLLELAVRFKFSQDTLISSVVDEYDRRLKYQDMHLEGIENLDDETVSRVSQESIFDIQQISEHFSEGIVRFIEKLNETDRNYLKMLALRLDFNEYYSNSHDSFTENSPPQFKKNLRYGNPRDDF